MTDTGGSLEASEGAIRKAERHRISRELHDSTSQLLVALELQLGELRRSGVQATRPFLLDQMAQVICDIRKSISEINSRKSAQDEDSYRAKVAVAKMFYSLGALNP